MADQSAKVVITAQNATAPGIRGVQRDLQGLQKQATSLTGSLKGMAGALGLTVGASAGIAALRSFVTSTIELNDALANTANKTGMTVEELSALQYAAKQADVEFGTLSSALVKFNRGIAEAGSGNKSAAAAFTQLGISLDTVKSMKPDELFLLAAQRISELGSEAERTKAEVDLFGRSGADLDPLFTGGAEGINRAKEAAKELGAVISTETNKKVTELGDKADQLKSRWSAFATSLLGESAPTIIRALDLIEASAKRPYLERLFRNISGLTAVEWAAGLTGMDNGQSSGSASGVINRTSGATGTLGETEEQKAARLKAEEERRKAAQKEVDYWKGIRTDLNADEQKFYAEMNEMAKDYADNTIEQIQRETDARLDAKDTYREWLKEQAKETELLGEIGAQAARNIQDAFAQFLFDPFKGGLKGMLGAFVNTVRQMIAQAASAAILKQFFGWMGGLGGFWGSVGGTLLKGITGKAIGGPVMGSQAYVVGERGPELFVPSTNGSITPNNRLGGSVSVSPVYNIDARGASADLVKSLPAILEANTRRAVELARATIYDDYSRGAFGRA